MHQRAGRRVGAYFDRDVRGIVERLLGEQLSGGGWNCEAENGSTRSSFNTTICVLEALLEWERTMETPPKSPKRVCAGRSTFWRADSSGGCRPARRSKRDRMDDSDWTRFAFPTWWHYDVLRGLEYLRSAGVTPDDRVAEAIDVIESKRDDDGRWALDTRCRGPMPVELDEGEGRPSRWTTLRALRAAGLVFVTGLNAGAYFHNPTSVCTANAAAAYQTSPPRQSQVSSPVTSSSAFTRRT